MAQAEKRAIRAAQAAVVEIDRSIEAAEQMIREQQQDLAELRRKRDRWAKLAEIVEDDKAPVTVVVNSVKAAGPGAIKAVSDYLAEHGSAYQSDVTEGTGLNSGTVTHALRALGAEHKITATGRKKRNSPEFEWNGDREKVSA
jgi:hypothetical protein